MATSARGNIIKKVGICPDCGTKFDPESFRVKVGKGIYMSYLCRNCAIEQGAEIIEVSLKEEKRKEGC